jgi:alpha-amylase/alpha-mannosidase (GH57 family)
MPGKYVCIHAHFYQPPRENPWIDEVEIEESADPFHDWNSRITRECYEPNSAARVLRGGKILEIVNNYEKISFNFGPTLFNWMERHEPEVYQKIQEADRASIEKRNGHGNAIAQVYNHSVMPLNSKRDMETQIIWGMKDFEHRFGRQAEGIWFAETAVNRESLLLAARQGIKFTILAPNQARRIRPLKADAEWKPAEGMLNTTMPYLYRPDDSSEIALFFYDGAISHAIAFEGLLKDGVELGNRLFAAFDDKKERKTTANRLVHVATDGETYGHHHRFGEMALAAALEIIEAKKTVRLTNYGEFLENNPPVMEVDIRDNSSWSCAHGVERWKSDCGCSDGGMPGWNQKWRAPLRNALNRLKDELDNMFEEGLSRLIKSPWDARNHYIDVIVNRDEESINDFFKSHVKKTLTASQVTELLKYFEMQVAAMKMFTSCGWFFADVSRLESLQLLKYAARAIELAQEVSLLNLEDRFLTALSKAKSNLKDSGTGLDIYEKHVLPMKLDPRQIAAHWLISGVLQKEREPETRIYSYNLELLDSNTEESIDSLLTVGMLRLTSTVTLESRQLVFCLLRFGGHDFNCSIRPFLETGIYLHLKDELLHTFRRHSMPEMIHAVEKHFGQKYYTIKALFDDERRKLVRQLLTDHIDRFGDAYRTLFEKNSKLMEFFVDVNVPIPEECRIAAKYVFEKRLDAIFTEPEGNHNNLKALDDTLKESNRWNIRLNYHTLHDNALNYLEHHINKLCDEKDGESAKIVEETMQQLKLHNITLDIWRLQKLLYPFYKAAGDSENKLYPAVSTTAGFKALFKIFGFAEIAEKKEKAGA